MWLYLIIIILTLTYYILKRNASYWKNLGVPGPQPLPFVGNIGQNFIGKRNVMEILTDIYKDYKQYPFVGVYRGTAPCLLVRDPNIIKNVLIKDFKYFANNDVSIDKEIDPLIGRNPFVMKDQEWKKTRQQLAPGFSSGKIKAVFPLVEDVSKRLVKYVEGQIVSSKTGLDTKELCTKFTCDNIAVCAFGMEGKCFEEPNSEFRQLAQRFMSPGSLQGIKFVLTVVFPKFSHLISLKVVPKDVDDRLMDIVADTLEYRKKNNIVRNDFLDYISQLSKVYSDFSSVDVTAHAANFFVDGVETSSNAMSFVLLDLAMNQECQTKLRDEINSVFEKFKGNFSYDMFQELTYLDGFINESFRVHPQFGFLSKSCSQRYTMETISPDYKNLTVTIEPGTPVLIPILGLHTDPKYFPDPEKFIPERFLNKNENSPKNVFLPFGDGPRACLGQRFGIFQIKIGIVQLIKNFEITVNEKTQLPLKYLPFYMPFFPKGGIWLNYRKI